MESIRSQFPDCTHILILDFEATCGRSIPKGEIEIIEIGAFLFAFTDEALEVQTAPSFHEYIKPVIHPKLTAFCTRLTGLAQSMVDDGLLFADAHAELFGFLSAEGAKPEQTIFTSWSDFDKKQFRIECLRNNLPQPFEHFLDLQKAFKQAQKSKSLLSVKKALDAVELEFEGYEHSGYFDALNTARLLAFSNW